MILKDNGGGGDFETVAPGTYGATCYRLIDLGTQRNEYQGEVSYKSQLFVSWEINEMMKDGKPFSVGAFYTKSLHEKANLRKHLEAWRGRAFTPDELKGFDPKTLLGKSCMVSVVETKTGKTKVQSISKLPKGMPVPDLVNPVLFFSLEEYDQKIFDSITNGLKAIIEKSPEYQAIHGLSVQPDVDAATVAQADSQQGMVDADDTGF